MLAKYCHPFRIQSRMFCRLCCSIKTDLRNKIFLTSQCLDFRIQMKRLWWKWNLLFCQISSSPKAIVTYFLSWFLISTLKVISSHRFISKFIQSLWNDPAADSIYYIDANEFILRKTKYKISSNTFDGSNVWFLMIE